MKMNSESTKKKLMYLSGEDFYFFCYSIFIILDSLQCVNGSIFKDYRKLAFLINIINDEKLIYIISKVGDAQLNPVDIEHLFSSYSSALIKRGEILKLLFTLENRGYLTLEKGTEDTVIDLSLNKEILPVDFFDKEMFSAEYRNTQIIRRCIPRLKVLKLETMLTRIYEKNGVKTWAL